MKRRGLDSVHSWCILTAIIMMYFILVIPTKMNGLLFVGILERFETDRMYGSMPFTLGFVVRCIFGPVVAGFGSIFGVRNVIFAGSFLAILGVHLCFFAEAIETVIFSLGVLYGFGLSFGALLLPQVLKQYFEKDLLLGFGIQYAGFCIATMIFYPLAESIFYKYGISGTFLIISGLMLNALPISMTLNDPKYRIVQPNPPEVKSKQKIHNNPSRMHENSRQAVTSNLHEKQKNLDPPNTNEIVVPCDAHEHLVLKQLNESNFETQSSSTVSDIAPSYERPQSDVPNTGVNEDDIKSGRKDRIVSSLLTLKVFCDPRFLVILVFNSLYLFVSSLFLMIILDASRDNGVSRSLEVHYLTFLPFSQLCGSLVLGWMTNRALITNLNLSAASFLCCVVSCQIFVWSSKFSIMLIGILAFGFFEAGFTVVNSAVIFDFTDEAHHSMALASRQMFYLPLGFTMPHIIGYFRGSLGSYNGIFHLLTGMSLVGFVSVLLLPCIARIHARHKT